MQLDGHQIRIVICPALERISTGEKESPMANKDGDIWHADPSKTLANMFEFNRQQPDPLTTERVIEHFKKNHPEIDWDTLNLHSPLIRDSIAAAAMKLDPNSWWDKPVFVAFEKAGLDHNNPAHWRVLLNYFCWAHFRPKRGRGAPALWSPQRYCRLLQDEDRVRRDHPTFSHENVYRTIVQRYEHYRRKNGKPLKPGRIKTALREARDPECNAQLAMYLSTMLQRGRSHFQLDWSPEVETKFTQVCIEKYCKEIASAWRRADNPVEY
jgi:hypothetical protein